MLRCRECGKPVRLLSESEQSRVILHPERYTMACLACQEFSNPKRLGIEEVV
jgi:hypothetical protein